MGVHSRTLQIFYENGGVVLGIQMAESLLVVCLQRYAANRPIPCSLVKAEGKKRDNFHGDEHWLSLTACVEIVQEKSWHLAGYPTVLEVSP